MEYIKSLVGKDHKMVIPPPPASTRKVPEIPKSPNKSQPRNKFVYRGFNWKNFFVESKIEEKKAEKYAKTFVKNMLSKTIIKSLDENSLGTFNIEPSDIPLILNHIKEINEKKDVVSVYLFNTLI